MITYMKTQLAKINDIKQPRESSKEIKHPKHIALGTFYVQYPKNPRLLVRYGYGLKTPLDKALEWLAIGENLGM